MLAKISQIYFPAKEVKFHRWCRSKYQVEGESIFQRKNSKTSNNASSAFSEIYCKWHKKREVHSEAFDTLFSFIDISITVILQINTRWILLNYSMD